MSSLSRVCICGQVIPFTCVIEGKRRNLKNRKFCLTCSPFGLHNTRDISLPRPDPMERFHRYQERERRERKAKLVELLGSQCCSCGYRKCIAAFEFHHRAPSQKQFPLSKENLLRKWPLLLAEAEKCDLYCANCHRELEEALRGALTDLASENRILSE